MSQLLTVGRHVIDLDTDECIIWPGSISPQGYGQLKVDGVNRTAHSHVMELLGYPKTSRTANYDHRCRVKACVNPRHLEYVSASVNNARASTYVIRGLTPWVCAMCGVDLTAQGNMRIELMRCEGMFKFRCLVCEHQRRRDYLSKKSEHAHA